MWQTRSEKCVYDPDTGIAAYDLSKTGNTISASDGKRYCVIFSANTGVQTYNVVMDGKCIGDTLYCTGNKLENPDDSEKVALEAVWTENMDCGPEKRITTTGNVIGTTLTEGVTDETLLAQYLIDYYDFPEKSAYTQNLLNALLVSPKDVKTAAESILDSSDYLDKDTILSKVEEILAECSDPLESMIYGDVNNDGIITIVDATIVQKYIVNMAHLDNVNQKLADVDVDAVITIKDATAVQKYIVNVDGYGFVQFCKRNKHLSRHVTVSVFIPKVLRLFHAEIFCNIILRHIVILTQLPYPFIIRHCITLFIYLFILTE